MTRARTGRAAGDEVDVQVEASPDAGAKAVRQPRGTVLVVEDEPSLAETIAFLLRSDGFDVAVAATGPEGLDAFRTTTPDLILLDLMLPGMNGLEVCRTIRRTSMVPIIMVTARAGEAEKVVGLAAGADDYLTKPFSIGELRARIRTLLRRRANQ
jgi:two-component system response regulator RegX3